MYNTYQPIDTLWLPADPYSVQDTIINEVPLTGAYGILVAENYLEEVNQLVYTLAGSGPTEIVDEYTEVLNKFQTEICDIYGVTPTQHIQFSHIAKGDSVPENYFKFDIQVRNTSGAVSSYKWDSCGAHGLIQRIRVWSGSNLLEDPSKFLLSTATNKLPSTFHIFFLSRRNIEKS
jgi:hypothetical protein